MEITKAKATVGSGTKVHVITLVDDSPFGTACGAISFVNCRRGMKSAVRIVKDDCDITCEKCKSIIEKE